VTYSGIIIPYQVTTGPGLEFAMPEMIGGRAYLEDGFSPAEGAIVYVRIGDSQPLSAVVGLGITGTSDYWALDLAQLRTPDAQSYYGHSDGDDITLEARGGPDVTAIVTVTVSVAVAGFPEMMLTAGNGRVPVTLQVTIEGRPAPPDDRWVIPVAVWVHDAGAPWTASTADRHGAVAYYQVSTGRDGTIHVALEPGTYDIRVRGTATLTNLVEGVTVEEGMSPVEVGTLVQGDIDGDNSVGALDYSAMVTCFGYATDDPEAPASAAACDLNGDGFITALDYSTILLNFGQSGSE